MRLGWVCFILVVIVRIFLERSLKPYPTKNMQESNKADPQEGNSASARHFGWGIAIGFGVGILAGSLFGNLGLGLALGGGFGAALGPILSSRSSSRRKAGTEQGLR